MDVLEAVRTLLAVRSYQDRPVPPEVVDRILEAGRLAASARNGQPWQFIVVQDRDTLRKVGELAKTGPYISQAPLAIAVAVERTPWAISDASRAIQNMALTAWSEGLGSNWVGFGGMEEVKRLLAIPDDLDLLAVVPFGYPAATAGKGRKARKPIALVAHREKHGRPFE
jgi:nitroreductase